MNDLDNVIQQVIKSRGIKGRIDNTSNMGEAGPVGGRGIQGIFPFSGRAVGD